MRKGDLHSTGMNFDTDLIHSLQFFRSDIQRSTLKLVTHEMMYHRSDERLSIKKNHGMVWPRMVIFPWLFTVSWSTGQPKHRLRSNNLVSREIMQVFGCFINFLSPKIEISH